MKETLKRFATKLCSLLTYPPALLCGFGKHERWFAASAQRYAMIPGVIGEYLRRAFYAHTLESCSKTCCIAFGTFFSHPQATLEEGVYIGAYCIIGRAHIGAKTQIGSNVHILSGRHQHVRDEQGNILGSEAGTFEDVSIGANCWIGTSAVVMANVGEGSTIGAGAVVTKDIPPGVVAAGVPAKVIRPVS